MTTHDIHLETPVRRYLTLPKHSQFILAIDSQFFYERGFANGIHQYELQQLYKEVAPYLSLRQRAGLEKNPAYRQVLPYKVLTQTVDDVQKIVAYRRLKGGGESRLYGLMSVGFGGHVDFEHVVVYEGISADPDVPKHSTVDLETTIRRNSQHELGSEVHYLTVSGGQAPFEPDYDKIVPANYFIHFNLKPTLGEKWKIEDDVHSVHVAFVYAIEADPRLQFVSGEPDKIEMLPPMTAGELLDSGMEMEEWTRLLLEKMVGRPARRPPGEQGAPV